MTDDPKASAAWQDVEQVLAQEPGLHVLKILIADARAADAQQIAALREALMARLNEATRLVDEERKRWYAALGGDHEGFAPEVVGQQIAALRAENEQLTQRGDEHVGYIAFMETRDTLFRKDLEAQLTALQAEQAQWQQKKG